VPQAGARPAKVEEARRGPAARTAPEQRSSCERRPQAMGPPGRDRRVRAPQISMRQAHRTPPCTASEATMAGTLRWPLARRVYGSPAARRYRSPSPCIKVKEQTLYHGAVASRHDGLRSGRPWPQAVQQLPDSRPTRPSFLEGVAKGIKSGRSCIGPRRIIHSTQKPAIMPSFPYPLWGHCHGTNSLFLPPWACRSGVCLPHTLLAGAPSCRCPSPADRATQATSTHALQGTPTVYRLDPAAAVRPVRA
jgi:hypothetical protein